MKAELFTLIAAISLSACGLFCATLGLRPAPQPGQRPQSMTITTGSGQTVRMNFWLYLPPGYPARERWPLILFLHGAGERGDDLDRVKIHGPPKRIDQEDASFPFVIVSPQCPTEGWWSDDDQIERLDALLEDVVSRYEIDPQRLYVTGLSMGGYGTWALAARYPHRFAAIAPICGGGDPGAAERMAHLPVWVFHGARDPVVPLEASQEMVDALREAGGAVTFTVYPEAGHDAWTESYANPALYEWFLQHRRTGGEDR